MSIVVTALVLGFVFAWMRLPIPAPLEFGGVLGIVCLWGGYRLGQYVFGG